MAALITLTDSELALEKKRLFTAGLDARQPRDRDRLASEWTAALEEERRRRRGDPLPPATVKAASDKAGLLEDHKRALLTGKIVLRYKKSQGILLCGDTKPQKDKIKAVNYPKRFRFSRRLPDDCAWYVQRSRNISYTRAEIDAVAESLRKAGVEGLVVNYLEKMSKLDVQAVKEQEEHPWATPVQAREIAKDHARVARRPTKLSDAEFAEFVKEPRLMPGAHRLKGLRKAMKVGGAKEVRRLRAAMRKKTTTKWHKEAASQDASRVIAEAALAENTWPPPPDRKDGYSEHEWFGIFAALEAEPLIAKAVADAVKYEDRLTKAIEKHGADDMVGTPGDGTAFWNHYQRPGYDLSRVGLRPLRPPSWLDAPDMPRDPATAKKAREWFKERAASLLADMEILADPKIWDYKKTDPVYVAKQLCKVDHQLTQAILGRLYGIQFEHGFTGRRQTGRLCDGKTTIREIKLEDAKDRLETSRRQLATAKRHKALAPKLIPVFRDASKQGKRELNVRRLDNALKRAGYKVGRGVGFSTWSSKYGGRTARLALTIAGDHYSWEATVGSEKTEQDAWRALCVQITATDIYTANEDTELRKRDVAELEAPTAKKVAPAPGKRLEWTPVGAEARSQTVRMFYPDHENRSQAGVREVELYYETTSAEPGMDGSVDVIALAERIVHPEQGPWKKFTQSRRWGVGDPKIRSSKAMAENEVKTRGDFKTVLAWTERQWHRDDEADLVGGKPIVSITFGAERDFVMRKRDDHTIKKTQVLHHGSLLVMTYEFNHECEHTVPARTKVLGARYNLTWRFTGGKK